MIFHNDCHLINGKYMGFIIFIYISFIHIFFLLFLLLKINQQNQLRKEGQVNSLILVLGFLGITIYWCVLSPH